MAHAPKPISEHWKGCLPKGRYFMGGKDRSLAGGAGLAKGFGFLAEQKQQWLTVHDALRRSWRTIDA